MAKKITTRKKPVGKKKTTGKKADAWHLKVAYSLGKAAHKVTSTIDADKKIFKGRRTKKTRKTGTALARPEPLLWASQEPLSPELKEIKAIADISGLTEAVEEMNRISLEHSRHPVIERVVLKVRGLSPVEQEALSRQFIERLSTVVYFNNAIAGVQSQVKLTEEECEKMSASLIECMSGMLEDLGLSEEDREVFKKLSGDIARPINELMQFYIHPRTFGQKVKRLWRMQRILIRVIKLARMTHSLKGQMPTGLMGAPLPTTPRNYWANDGVEVVRVKSNKI